MATFTYDGIQSIFTEYFNHCYLYKKDRSVKLNITQPLNMFVYTEIEILPSETKLRQGNVFTGVYQLFCSWGNVCLSACWDIHSVGRPSLEAHPPETHPSPSEAHPPEAHPAPTVTAADGTHPTGMFSF